MMVRDMDAFTRGSVPRANDDAELADEKTWDRSRGMDFVAPYFFFSERSDSRVSYVSPSVADVLGFDPARLVDRLFSQILCPTCLLNQDYADCQRLVLRNGGSLHVLRSVRNADGDRRILSINTVGVSESPNTPPLRRHHIAHDVTESVERHAEMATKLAERDLLLPSVESSRYSHWQRARNADLVPAAMASRRPEIQADGVAIFRPQEIASSNQQA
jgi:hypothetical protein